MLVIVSDLHLTDGTTGLRIPAGAFRLFRERLESMAYDASKRADDTYQPIREFDLVLLGDIFDLLRSTKWNNEQPGENGYARPWSNPDDPALARKVEQIVDGILEKNAESCEILHGLAGGTAISLPPATSKGEVDRRVSRDRRSGLRLPVKVNIHYMNGNHDWYFHLPGAKFDSIRQKVIDNMGLRNSSSPFPHDPSDSATIQSIFAQHQVYARHGDIFDPFNYVKEKGRNYSCLGDALVIELFNPFPPTIESELGDKLPKEFYMDLNEMGSIRPGTLTPVWVAGLLEKYQVEKKDREQITEIWRKLIDNFLELDFLKEMDKWGFDIVDSLEIMLKVLRRFSLDTLDDLAPTAKKLIDLHASIWGGGGFGLDKNASNEKAYQSKEAKFIVYGHSHDFKVVPLRSTHKNGTPFDQMYMNSGTWHPLHELGVEDTKERGFLMHKTMSYLGFYRSDERKGRVFETWSGTLDV